MDPEPEVKKKDKRRKFVKWADSVAEHRDLTKNIAIRKNWVDPIMGVQWTDYRRN